LQKEDRPHGLPAGTDDRILHRRSGDGVRRLGVGGNPPASDPLNCQTFYAAVGLPIQAFRAVLLSLSTLGITAFTAISTVGRAAACPTRA
jgi:hypothetical protein